MPITGYISEIVAGGALLSLWLSVRSYRNELRKEFDEFKIEVSSKSKRNFESIKEVKEVYMPSKEHGLICKSNTLEVKAHISEEIKSLANLLFVKMDAVSKSSESNLTELVKDIKENRKDIDRLDRRTKHLKDAD
jgi:hypothetical protein